MRQRCDIHSDAPKHLRDEAPFVERVDVLATRRPGGHVGRLHAPIGFMPAARRDEQGALALESRIRRLLVRHARRELRRVRLG